MNSMTGYGRGEATNGDVTVVVELKSVNNRFRDLNVRMRSTSYWVACPEHSGTRCSGAASTSSFVDAVEVSRRSRQTPSLPSGTTSRWRSKRLARQDDDIPSQASCPSPVS